MNRFRHISRMFHNTLQTFYRSTLSIVRPSLTQTRVRTSEKIQFTHRLALYLRSGIPIRESMALITTDARDTAHTRVLHEVLIDLTAGRTLATSLARFPRAYGSFQVNLIAIGESSGTLAKSLQQVSDLLTAQQQLRSRLMSALAYPLCILIGTVAVSGFLILFAFPKIVPLLKSMRTELPVPTQLLISLSDLLTSHGLLILLILGLSSGVCVVSTRLSSVRTRLESALLYIPLMGHCIRWYFISTTTRLLAVLIGSGIRIEVALRQVRSGLRYTPYVTALMDFENNALSGNRLSGSMRAFPRLFPSAVIEITASGEATGKLSDSLHIIADVYEERLHDMTRTLSILIEPILMLLMGLIVGFVALAIILPMYGLTQNLSLS